MASHQRRPVRRFPACVRTLRADRPPSRSSPRYNPPSPAYEYRKALDPRILKCDFCFERRKTGALPACVEHCPVEALSYGPREELVRVARDRVRRQPELYVQHIYGEYEVGGTNWMYLAGTDFAALQFPALGAEPAPGVSESIQHGIFAYFIPPVALYALLGSIMWMARHRGEEDES